MAKSAMIGNHHSVQFWPVGSSADEGAYSMISQCRGLLIVLLFESMQAMTGWAQDQHSRKQLVAQHNAYIAALRANDAQKLLRILTTDFVMSGPSGLRMKRSDIEDMAKQTRSVKSAGSKEQTDAITSISIHGRTATILCKEHFVSSYQLPGELPQGKKHKTESNAAYRESWINEQSTWKLKKVETVSQQTILDGKPAKSLSTPR